MIFNTRTYLHVSVAGAALLMLSGCTPHINSVSTIIPRDPCFAIGRADLGTTNAAISLPKLPTQFEQARLEDGRSEDGAKSDLALGALIVNVPDNPASLEGRAETANHTALRPIADAMEQGLGDLDFMEGVRVTEAGADRAENVISELEDFRAKMLRPGLAVGGRLDDSDGDRPTEIVIKRSDWEALNKKIVDTTQELGWVAAAQRQLGRLARSQGRAEDVAEARERLLIAEYMLAYFRHGKIIKTEFKDAELLKTATDAIDKIQVAEAKKAVGDAVDALFKAYRKQACTKDTKEGEPCKIFDYTSSETFVTRAGSEYGFQVITGTIDITADKIFALTDIDWEAIPPDLVRVSLEALGDEAARVPGAANSTMCKVRPGWCSVPGDAAVVTKKLELVNRAGDVTEASVSSIFGAAVRGGWLASLNNEVLADTLTTAAAVTLRKGAEAAMWKAIDQCPARSETTVLPDPQNVVFKFDS